MPFKNKPVVKHAPGHKANDWRESIYEFSAVTTDGELAGGLISLTVTDGGGLRVEVYRCDSNVTVISGPRAQAPLGGRV